MRTVDEAPSAARRAVRGRGPALFLLALSALAVSLAGCRPPLPVRRDAPALPAGLPERRAEHPQAAALPGGELAVVWGSVRRDGTADIAFAVLGPSRELSPAVRVNPEPGSAVAGRQVGPRVAALPGGRVAVSWVDRARDPSGDIVLALSDDRGRSFTRPVRVNDDPAGAGQEYHDLEALPGGRLAAVWFDERDAPAGTPNKKQVYFASSIAGAARFGPNERITPPGAGVCPCCRPDLAVAPDGSLHVAYRGRTEDTLTVRVLSRRREADAFGAPVAVTPHAWPYPGCPVDGPALAAGPEGELTVAWMDGSSGTEGLWLARSTDRGRSFASPRPLAGIPVDLSGLARRERSRGTRRPDGFPSGDAPGGSTAAEGARHPAAAEAVTSFSTPSGPRPGRADLIAHPRLGPLAAWEDTGGRVWLCRLGPTGGPPGRPGRIAGTPDAPARSVTLAEAGRAVHAFWTEERVAPPARGAPGPGAATVSTTASVHHRRLVPDPPVAGDGPTTASLESDGARAGR